MADESQIVSLEQLIQNVNNIARMLGEAIETVKQGIWVYYSVGVKLSNTDPTTVFTATGHQEVVGLKVSDSAGTGGTADVDWLDDSASLTINQVENGVVGAAYPLIMPGPLALETDDTLVVTGASGFDVTVTWREQIV